MILVSYTNQRGEEIILDDTEKTFLGELYGREGCEAPALDFVETTYADGSTDVIAVNVKPRDVTLYFWAPTDEQKLKIKLRELKQKLIQSGTQDGDWGKLMIRRQDGRKLYLNCVYTGGLDELVRESWHWIKFALTFRATDPYFHDDVGFEVKHKMQQTSGYLYFAPDLYMGPDLYMQTASTRAQDVVEVEGEKVWPTIVVHGPAANIGIINKTTGKKIVLNSSVTLGPEQTITITTDPLNRSIRDTDGNSLIRYLTDESSLNFWLQRGRNSIEFDNSDTRPESFLQFKYQESFLTCE